MPIYYQPSMSLTYHYCESSILLFIHSIARCSFIHLYCLSPIILFVTEKAFQLFKCCHVPVPVVVVGTKADGMVFEDGADRAMAEAVVVAQRDLPYQIHRSLFA